MKQVMRECQIRKAAGQNYRFTGDSLDGYQIQSGAPNDYKGDPSTGLISADPSNANEYPRFDLNNSSGSFTCTFKGTTYQNPKQCLDVICATTKPSPPNTSTLFSDNSGLACRTVDSASVSIGSGYFYLDGKSDVNLEIQPVIFKAGGESWEVSGVQTNISSNRSNTKWLDDFADALIAKINNSDTLYSAEKDISTPGGVLIYTPSGALVDDISMDVSKGIIDADYNNASNGTNPWAYPQIGEAKGNSGMPYGVNFVADESSDNASSTTICDGK